eukprot:GHVQ01016967.1.p1 GENE.GHVQ01016967.1~~GHVQ01016967.1.p1  ORF type:complete len:242 (-),score=20.37 GHVQ01016967.1:187-912(-)
MLEGWVTTLTAEEAWEIFRGGWIAVFGVPEEVVTDGDKSFRGIFDAGLKEMGTGHITTGPYYPQGNGIVEASHKFLRHGLGALALAGSAKLKDALQYVVLAYNQTLHPQTGETPGYLQYGGDTRLPYVSSTLHTEMTGGRMFQVRALQAVRNCFMWRALRLLDQKARKQAGRVEILRIGDLVIFLLSERQRREAMRSEDVGLAIRWSEPHRILRQVGGDHADREPSRPWSVIDSPSHSEVD